MEPPLKKPRLSLFNQHPSGLELDNARYNNDMDLKRRFESIFTKYAQDFTGIGDEIDIVTGEVVVNNGHLESMETETDPGIDHLRSEFAYTGRSMLRAMTVSLDSDLPGPDDVLTSIETIAENATFTNGPINESESANSDLWRTSTSYRSQSSSDDLEEPWSDIRVEPYNSDSDSLFEDNQLRSESVDSLFEGESSDQTTRFRDGSGECLLTTTAEAVSHQLQTVNGGDDLIARFGPDIGKEVLNLIDQQQEAHIEPAWRIPVKLNQRISHPSTTRVLSPSIGRSPGSKRNKSLWTLPEAVKIPISPIGSMVQNLREESVDPLQEDFHNEQENPVHHSRDDDIPNSSESESADLYEFSGDDVVEVAATGSCPYCKVNFTSKSGVMTHWDRWLQQPAMNIKVNDPHDLGTMKLIRSEAFIHRRGPRLLMEDFRTMVELHEGAGLSFDHIFASKTLKTRKTGPQLQKIYDQHRSSPMSHESSRKQRAWTAVEEQALQEMCENPFVTLATLRRGLKGRDELDIGNHLADIWLGQLTATGHAPAHASLSTRVFDVTQLRSAAAEAISNTRGDLAVAKSIVTKRETSSDELFTAF